MTPDLTIIIISWNLENFITQAIASAFAQDVGSCEIIVVDNGSDDGTIAKLHEFQSTKTHFYNLILNTENCGLGPARNQGVARAKGKYIAFLDGDDWFELQTLSPVLEQAQKNRAELVIFNYRQVFISGKIRPNKYENLLHSGDCSEPAKRRDLFRNFNVAWNKLYSRSFIDKHHLQFADGYYEDVDWSYKALICASRVAASDIVVVNYRKDRDGSITNTQSDKHMQAIDRFRELLEFADKNPELCQPYKVQIFERIVRNTLTLLSGKGTRLPAELKPVFFGQVQALLNAHDREKKIKVRNANTLVYSAMRSGSFFVFNAIKGINGLRLSR